MRTTADKGGGGSKIGKILRTSLMDGPLYVTKVQMFVNSFNFILQSCFDRNQINCI